MSNTTTETNAAREAGQDTTRRIEISLGKVRYSSISGTGKWYYDELHEVHQFGRVVDSYKYGHSSFKTERQARDARIEESLRRGIKIIA